MATNLDDKNAVQAELDALYRAGKRDTARAQRLTAVLAEGRAWNMRRKDISVCGVKTWMVVPAEEREFKQLVKTGRMSYARPGWKRKKSRRGKPHRATRNWRTVS